MRIVILGGGFCGALIAKKLDSSRKLEITLIDKKNYFEYTPSIHKVVSCPSYLDKITVPYSHFLKNVRVIIDNVVHVTPTCVETEKKKIGFDYLVVSTGIDYPIMLENDENVFVLKNGNEAADMSTKMSKADSIIIIGGGLIGVEIAGELITKTKNKKINIVHSHKRLLERNPVKASSYAQKCLEKHGINIIFNEKVIRHEDQSFLTDKKRCVEAEAGIWCAGVHFKPWFMNGFNDSIFTDKKSLKVNQYLQLKGYNHIFVGGDINNIREEKTAQNAERHASLIVKNIKRLLDKKTLIAYQQRKIPLVISLGDHDGIMTFSRFVITGFLPSIVKRLIEWWVLGRLKH